MNNDIMKPVLKIENLSKSLGRRQILHNINLSIYPGEIFGFLGPNGSGKTTTIKLALGLLKIETGSVNICGYDIKKDFEAAIEKVGGIIENPEMYKYLTGRENLDQYRRMYGNSIPAEKIDDVVKLVHLEERINDKISKYSLGMRQRLGIAQALLHSPKLLVLDEPTNGLDPQGIKELRDILKTLSHNQGIAVFVSSHMLAELELMCDRFGIIDRGTLIDVKTITEIQNVNNDSATVFVYEIETDNAQAANDLLNSEEIKCEVSEKNIHITAEREKIPDVIKLLAINGVRIYSCTQVKKSLEEAFIEMTTQGGVGL